MKALLVLNGDIRDKEKLMHLGKKYDFILCADGGSKHCLDVSLMPTLIIGDLDSTPMETLNQIKEHDIPIMKYPPKKDKTDSELAIDYLIDKRYKEVVIMGAIGNRMDHTLANLLLLKKLNDNNIKGKIVNSNNIIYLVDKELILSRKTNLYLSIIPISDAGIIMTLRGFEYNIDNTSIEFGSTFGISNRILSDKGEIIINSGECLAIISED